MCKSFKKYWLGQFLIIPYLENTSTLDLILNP